MVPSGTKERPPYSPLLMAEWNGTRSTVFWLLGQLVAEDSRIFPELLTASVYVTVIASEYKHPVT